MLQEIKDFNPAWLVVAINLYIPFLVARLTHRNNLKLVQERWLGKFREEVAEFLANCEERARLIERSQKMASDQRQGLDAAVDANEVRLFATKARISLLFVERHRSKRKHFVELCDRLYLASEVSKGSRENYQKIESDLIAQVESNIEQFAAEITS